MFKIAVVFSLVIIFLLSFFIFISYSKVNASETTLVSPLPTNNDFTPTPQTKQIKLEPVLKNKINILFLGLDGRVGDRNPRCDAIHVVTFDPNDNTIVITSVPRGIEVEVSKNEVNYISNYCHYFGIEAAKKQIEKITKLPIDYAIKLGFSQALGMMRTLNMPTTETLAFLRNRNIPYGDYQRSHNQAVFIKDMLTSNIAKISNVPEVFQYLIYKMIDTDMPFDVAKELLDQIKNNQASRNPNSIRLISKPDNFLKLKEIHFNEADKKWVGDEEFKEYQDKLNIYLNNLLTRVDAQIKNGNNAKAFSLLKTPFNQQIWLQLEDEKLRNEYHFLLLKDYIQTSAENEKIISYITAFISEMELAGQNEYKIKAENLLKGII